MTARRLLIRTDGNGSIGAGHIGRCSAIAEAAVSLECEALFAVSDEESAEIVRRRGFQAVVVGGDFRKLDVSDVGRICKFAENAHAVLADTYAATPRFLSEMHLVCQNAGVRLGYIDDLYTFEDGYAESPRFFDVDALINYSFGASDELYKAEYEGVDVDLLIGPTYAPVALRFTEGLRACSTFPPRNVLVTTGSTNPNWALERMVEGCHAALPDATVDVVVGARAEYAGLEGSFIRKHAGIGDLCPLMRRCDMAISAAGTTLYELACMGLPTVAVPIVENQMANMRGLSVTGIAITIGGLDWCADDVRKAVSSLLERDAVNASQDMRETVDGRGAERVARHLLLGRLGIIVE